MSEPSCFTFWSQPNKGGEQHQNTDVLLLFEYEESPKSSCVEGLDLDAAMFPSRDLGEFLDHGALTSPVG